MEKEVNNMRKLMSKMLDNMAMTGGYNDRLHMLRDYGFIPTVLTSKHKKIEILSLFVKSRKH